MKKKILQKRESALNTIQEYINEKLYPRKVNILNQGKADYKKVPSITDIFRELGITEDEYYNTLSISNDEYLWKNESYCQELHYKEGENFQFEKLYRINCQTYGFEKHFLKLCS